MGWTRLKQPERTAPVSVRGGTAASSESPARAPRALPSMGSPSSPLAKQGPASADGSIVVRFLPDSRAEKSLPPPPW
jgi:hypothetical protein